ncbi:TolC family protein, partial [Mitsuaria sp. TWR114]|uniref:TolC family protein n=1 Tax=Mitsuaria sp. TWR114 TaxID=2601731 RepID=UPI00164A48F2
MAAAAATVALLAGCVNLAPEHQRPEAPVAPQWPQGPGAETADAKVATELQWQQFFRDERLKQLIDLALKNNRDLRVALLNVDVARAQANVTAANRWPTVNLGLSAQRGPQTTSSGDSQIVSVYQAGLQVTSYELDLFSRVKNQSAAAFAQYLATDEAARSARISLVAGVAQAYLAVQADEELLALTRQTLATREDSLKLMQLKFDNGAASNLDLSTAKSSYESARATLAQAERTRQQDLNALTLLVGQTLPDALPQARPLSDQTMGALLAGALAVLVAARRAPAEQQLVGGRGQHRRRPRGLLPEHHAHQQRGHGQQRAEGPVQPERVEHRGLGADADLRRGTGEEQRAAARANREIAVAQYEKTVQTAFKEVADALAGRAR